MAGFKGKFDSNRQDWETPKELFDTVDAEFHFTLDAAASESNKKVKKFISAEQDAMTLSWGKDRCWLNPPYGKGHKLSAWVKKAYQESLTGATTVMLIPARTNTNWFHDYCLKYGEVRFVRGRPKFGGADHGLPQPLCFIIFRANIRQTHWNGPSGFPVCCKVNPWRVYDIVDDPKKVTCKVCIGHLKRERPYKKRASDVGFVPTPDIPTGEYEIEETA